MPILPATSSIGRIFAARAISISLPTFHRHCRPLLIQIRGMPALTLPIVCRDGPLPSPAKAGRNPCVSAGSEGAAVKCLPPRNTPATVGYGHGPGCLRATENSAVGLAIQRVRGLPAGQMPRITLPFVVLQLQIAVDEAVASRSRRTLFLSVRRNASKRLRGSFFTPLKSLALGRHVDIQALARVALVVDAIEAGGQHARLEQARFNPPRPSGAVRSARRRGCAPYGSGYCRHR